MLKVNATEGALTLQDPGRINFFETLQIHPTRSHSPVLRG